MHKTGRERREEGIRRAKKVLDVWEAQNPRFYSEMDENELLDQLHLYTSTRKPCSKWCCGNPRRHFGKKTIQELREISELK